VTLELRDISKAYGPIQALDGVSLEVNKGDVHGLCGHNGAGKSTLVKVLMGVVPPDAGEIRIDGERVIFRSSKDAYQAGLAIVDQELGLVPVISVVDNVLLGNLDEGFITHRRARRRRARSLLAAVGLGDVDLRAPLTSLAPGERKLVEIAHALSHDARLLILDEPTASLSHAESRMVFEAVSRVTENGGAVIFVSHRLDEVFEICNRVTVLRDGKLVASKAIEELDRPTLVDMMVGDIESRSIAAAANRNAPAVKIRGLSVPPNVHGLDLDVPPGKVLGIAGQVGSGASDVLRGLGGVDPATRDEFTVGTRSHPLRRPSLMAARGVHYVTNDRKTEGLFLDKSVATNLTATRLKAAVRHGVLTPRSRRRRAEELTSVIEVRSDGIGQSVGSLSGGNQQKVLIGRCLGGPGGELLLLDDPTRGVDVKGRAEIHELIGKAAEAGNSLIFVSTELDELLELADVIVTMFHGRIVSVAAREETGAREILADMTHTSTREIAT
jgi:ABC-type sugar transport system ATPase subunit